ncbi:F0F1 ATP synthase subunit A [Larkinella harenae]
MNITPDQTIYWQYGFLTLNNTIVTTWAIMAVLAGGSWLITRNLSPTASVTGKQGVLEIIVLTINAQIEEIGLKNPARYISFIGTLFLFIIVANLAVIFPGYRPPTGSLSTTAALAVCVFTAVPVYSISKMGLGEYVASYARPNAFMIPFNIIGELSRTLALAFRLFGNIMSGEMIVSILLTLTPFFFPIVMNLFGMLTGTIQAYIFSILATVYIAAAEDND